MLGLCAAPELHPRYGRLFAYLHDDVTRRLASPRLVGELLSGEGVAPADVLACFGHAAPLRRSGALRLIEGDGTTPLADRAAKVADPLAAFLLGLAAPVDPAGEGRLRREPPRERNDDRPETVAQIASLLAVATASCRSSSPVPTPPALVASATGRGLLLADVRELGKPEVMADAALCCALEGRLLCGDGLDALEPAERTKLVRVLDEHPDRLVLLAPTRAGALTLGDRTVLLVETPMPSFPERAVAWAEADRRRGHARRRRQVPALARPDPRGRRGGDDHREHARRARRRRPRTSTSARATRPRRGSASSPRG